MTIEDALLSLQSQVKREAILLQELTKRTLHLAELIEDISGKQLEIAKKVVELENRITLLEGFPNAQTTTH